MVSLQELGIGVEQGLPYIATPWGLLLRSLRALGVRREDVLVDYGAGMGRVLIAAMGFPFQRIVGVEISPELAVTARANVGRRTRRVRAGQVEVIVADAAEWDVPDDATVFYMACPVIGPAFAAAIERLLVSVDRRPRRARLVYFNPFEHNYLLGTGRFQPISVLRPRVSFGTGPIEECVTYEVLPEAGRIAPADRRRVGLWADFRDTSGLISGFGAIEPLPPAR